MIRKHWLAGIAAAATLVAGCASCPEAKAPAREASDHDEHQQQQAARDPHEHDHDAAAPGSEPAPGGYRLVPVATAAGPGEPVQSAVVADTAHVKAVVITLRGGASLPVHATPHAAAIQSLSGSGEVTMGHASEPLAPGRLLLLEPGVEHAVRPAAGGDMVLLVLHMKGKATP